jgi:hypothetical protein
MLDTLKLSLVDYEIAPDADFDVYPPSFNTATKELDASFPLWRRGDGYVRGVKAVHNEDFFNVTVKPLCPATPEAVRCTVQFSVPKIIGSSNYAPATEEITRAALKQLESDLRRSGVRTNLSRAELSRLDACRTIETAESYETYQPVLSALRGQRMHKRDYGTTFLWHNTQQEVAVYDKIAEMKHRKHSVESLPKNSVRFEWRALKSKKVQTALGMKTVEDLLSDFGHVEKTYGVAMQKQLFRYEVSEFEALSVTAVAEQMQRMKDCGVRYWAEDCINALAYAQLLPHKKALLAAVELVATNRMQVSRVRRKLERIEANAMALEVVSPAGRSLRELYDELEQKVLSPDCTPG